jgi:photosystem II stability/assembly factor-like uncharacterized protein
VLLNGIHMVDSHHGWAVGHDAVILKTTDGGNHWQKVFEEVDEQRPLLDVWFKDNDHGYAVGAYGYFLTTSDGGTTWQDRLINDEHDYHLNAITDDGSGTLYIAAESGYVYRSRDGGKSWQVLNLPYEGSFFDIEAYGDTVIVVGLRGNAFVSTDAGETWRSLSTGVQAALTSITRLDSGHVVITGHAGVVLIADKQLTSMDLYRLHDRSAISDSLVVGRRLVLVGEHGISTLNVCRVFASQLSGVCK